ncbi:DNA alkylation repair protein [Niveibacterium sp. 24ML]|uniref:DNA alkylation repair protein n=1 Tax=Niveibacterium sp. 24ML TaxID=2985512 RepID=UPI00226D71F5|nr:DNA alkylation repair protein [Niveibacterium sp. 24ML]MCX9156283.1 DNA alkylation repair protein [Niveibacterium sp. 24ML]
MDTRDFTQQVLAALLPLASAERRVPMQAYMKHRFPFLGIATPARRAATLPLIRALRQPCAADLIAAATALWALPEREFQYVAADLLARHSRQITLAELPALLDLVRARAWWDSVDPLAGVIGDVLQRARVRDPGAQASMDRAVQDGDFWVRRVAMLHQLGWREATDLARLFAYAERLAPEREFFIRKAIGWALRDAARHHPAAVQSFVAQMGDRLAALSRREALKHLG